MTTAAQLEETARQEEATAREWEGEALKSRREKDFLSENFYMSLAEDCRTQAANAERELEIMKESL